MKKIALALFSVAVITCLLAMTNRPAATPAADNAIFNWTATEYDFGKIKVSVPVTYEFKFTNKGNIPLVISTVQASCGCTVTSYTKMPIEPGAEGFVKATYNAANVGQFTKTVTVNANTQEGVARLTIKGEVIAVQ